jgi:hypothetical protein
LCLAGWPCAVRQGAGRRGRQREVGTPRVRPHHGIGQTNGIADQLEVAPVDALRQERPAFEQQVSGLGVARHSIGAQEQSRFGAIERADPRFGTAAERFDRPEEKVATVGKKLGPDVPLMSLAAIDPSHRLAGRYRANLHLPQPLVLGRGREDDRVLAVPAPTGTGPWGIGDDLCRATGGIHILQLPPCEKRDIATVRRPERRTRIIAAGQWSGDRPRQRTRPELLPAVGGQRDERQHPSVRRQR